MIERALPLRARLHGTVRARHGQDLAPAHVPDRLIASWQRSEEYGVPVEAVEPAFSGTIDGESLFSACGKEVLAELHRTLANEPISLMLTDPDGLVLNRVSGDRSLLRALDAVHLAPGFTYGERAVGTNGLGLALADRAPAVVRAEEHYSLSLCTYTCAAAPVLDPLTGRLDGCVNLTTWSDSSSDLLLALAQSAAGNTAALMLARSRGQQPRPASRGAVFQVEAPRLEPGAGTLTSLSSAWAGPLAAMESALAEGRTVCAVGEAGSGRATMLAQALRRHYPRDRILAASIPDPRDVDAWLGLWTPELGKPHTAVLVRDIDLLPSWVAERVRDLVLDARGRVDRAEAPYPVPIALAATRFEDIPAPLASLVDTVVAVPPLRDRPDDVAPLARHVALRARGRELQLTRSAENAMRSAAWPGNVAQLVAVVRRAATRTDVIDVQHLPADVLSGSTRRLSRIEAFERDEIVRVLGRPGISMREAADELGMSRATIYRKIAQYDLNLHRHAPDPPA